MASQEVLREEPSRGSFINDPKVRGIFFQAVVVILLVAGVWWIVHNVIENLQRLHIASGFSFLKNRAGVLSSMIQKSAGLFSRRWW